MLITSNDMLIAWQKGNMQDASPIPTVVQKVPRFFDRKTIAYIDWMVSYWFSSYRNVMPLFFSYEQMFKKYHTLSSVRRKKKSLLQYDILYQENRLHKSQEDNN